MIEGFSVSGGRSTCFEWAIWGISCGWLQPLGIGVQVAGLIDQLPGFIFFSNGPQGGSHVERPTAAGIRTAGIFMSCRFGKEYSRVLSHCALGKYMV